MPSATTALVIGSVSRARQLTRAVGPAGPVTGREGRACGGRSYEDEARVDVRAVCPGWAAAVHDRGMARDYHAEGIGGRAAGRRQRGRPSDLLALHAARSMVYQTTGTSGFIQ